MGQRSSYNYPKIFRAYRTYVINASGTASAPLLLDFREIADADEQAEVYCTADCTVKFGDSKVVADNTVTDNAMPVDNIFCPGSAIRLFDIERNKKHVSVIGSGTVYIVTGYGEGGRR